MRRQIGIALDTAGIQRLADLLTPYVERESLNLQASYEWKIPSDVPVAAFTSSGLSFADANVRLKRSLSEAWHLSGSDREALVRWYVARWGRVYRNSDMTIQRYVLTEAVDLAGGPLDGVASWSKVLAMRDPAQYAIFDARVSAALNALQVVQGDDPILFPRLPNQNRTIKAFNAWLKAKHLDARRVQESDVYPGYMALLRQIGGRLGHEAPDQAEMVLFANAEVLAKQAMQSHWQDGSP